MPEEEKPSRGSMYDWERWMRKLPEGRAWMVTRHLDYKCESRSFAGYVYRVARERGLRATVHTLDDYVLFCFYDPTSYWKPNMPALKDVKKIRKKLGME